MVMISPQTATTKPAPATRIAFPPRRFRVTGSIILASHGTIRTGEAITR